MEPQYEDGAQVSIISDYLPKDIAEEMVGTHVKMMAAVWAQLDEKFGDPPTIMDEVCHDIENLVAKALGREFISKPYRLL